MTTIQDMVPKNSPGSWVPPKELLQAVTGKPPEIDALPSEGSSAEFPHTAASTYPVDLDNPIPPPSVNTAPIPEMPEDIWKTGGVVKDIPPLNGIAIKP